MGGCSLVYVCEKERARASERNRGRVGEKERKRLSGRVCESEQVRDHHVDKRSKKVWYMQNKSNKSSTHSNHACVCVCVCVYLCARKSPWRMCHL